MTNKNIKYTIYLILMMIYIIPNGLIFGAFNAIHNHIFSATLGIIYIIPFLKKGKIYKKTLYIWFFVFIIALYTKKWGFIDMLIIPIMEEFINKKEEIKKFLLNSKIINLSIFFTILYSFVYSILGLGGRGEGIIGSGLVFTAIGEINLTGLSIFCLALLERKRNVLCSNLLFIMGLLTISRSYVLAIICILFFNIGFIKKAISKFLKYLTYFNLTLISSVILILFGILSISIFINGGIASHNSTAGFLRLIKFNDYSNYFRFLAIYLVAKILLLHPKEAFLGISDEEYLKYGYQICSEKGLVFLGIGPHNIFFSHLKIYGIAVLFEIYYISKYLKRIITKNNFGIFIAIFFYCIILGTGFNSYWLYLAIITLIMYEE